MEKACKVSEEYVGERIDHFLTKIYPSYSRAFYQKLIRSNRIKLNKNNIDPDHKLRLNDRITIELPEEKDGVGKKYKLDVIFEDKSILVINKPAGIIVHPAGNSGKFNKNGKIPTILDIFLASYPDMKSRCGGRSACCSGR